MARVSIELGEPPTGPVLERTFITSWEASAPSPVRLENESASRLVDFVERLRRGDIEVARLREAAPSLGALLGSDRLATPPAKPALLELVAETAQVLTEVPWEAAALGTTPLPEGEGAPVASLLASWPVCRLVPPATPQRAATVDVSRPRVLVCISNPPGIDGGQIAVGPICVACDQALEPYPVFQSKTLAGPLTWARVAAEIRHFQPNLAFLVAHGSSNPEGASPTLAFVREADRGGVDRVPVADVAEALAQPGSCCLVGLIACDQVRASGYSAAWELVRQGTAEVLAMQGSIEQRCARTILTHLLSELLVGQSLPTAAAAARLAARPHPHAVLPTVFRSADQGGAAELLPLTKLYRRAIGALRSRVTEQRAFWDRADLRGQVELLLQGRGVAAVGGGFGNGCSALLRAAIESSLQEPHGRHHRPIFYLDCDRRTEGHSFAEWVSRELLETVAEHPVLRPKRSPESLVWSEQEDELAAWAVEAEISVVLDDLPYHPSPEETALVKSFARAYSRPDCRAVLLLGGAGSLLALAPEATSLLVPPLSEPETKAYVLELLPGADPGELYRQTGGTLLLLDLERRMRTDHRQRIPGATTAKAGIVDTHAVDTYVDRVIEWLSPTARQAALRLAHFPHPLDTRLVAALVTPDLAGALEELVDTGLATAFADRGVDWVVIPERKAERLLVRSADEAAGAAGSLAGVLAARYEQQADDAMRELIELGGGGTYLKTVQPFLLEATRADVAVGLPLLAVGTSLPAADLLALFQTAVAVLDAAGEVDADVLLAAARAALNVGRPGDAESWLAKLPPNLDLAYEGRRLSLRAAIHKDHGQVEALAEILECYERATQLAGSASADTEADLERLREEIAIDSLPAALFLVKEPAAAAAARLAPVLSHAAPRHQALLLATLAEREMKEPPEEVDWGWVAEWLTAASSALGEGGDDRLRTYARYQLGQYLRRRPEPRLAEAWRTYEESRAAGQRAGEPRRQGLALLRLVELERDHAKLRQPPDTWPQARLAELDAVVARLAPARLDALSMRVAGRLQAAAATLDIDVDSRRRRLTQAAQAYSARALSAPSDDHRFAEVLATALELDLGPAGDFLLAQRWLASFRAEIDRRLAITVDLEQPEASRQRILEWLEQHSEGRTHGKQPQR